jgi:hypothetical protein
MYSTTGAFSARRQVRSGRLTILPELGMRNADHGLLRLTIQKVYRPGGAFRPSKKENNR